MLFCYYSAMMKSRQLTFINNDKLEERKILELIHKINVSKADVETFRDVLENIPSKSILEAEEMMCL